VVAEKPKTTKRRTRTPQKQEGPRTITLKGKEYELIEYTTSDAERHGFPRRMSQAWLDEAVPGMDDRVFGMLLHRLLASGWTGGDDGTITTRVLPLRAKRRPAKRR
jgi:hypothetical protein